jgi:hypothetical protein
MVEVEEQKRALPAIAVGTIDGLFEARDQQQPVWQSGQGIMLREIFQRRFLLPRETVRSQHAGNKESVVQHHIGRGLVEVPKQIEQVRDMAIQREEQSRQAQHPGTGGQPVQIDVCAGARRPIKTSATVR